MCIEYELLLQDSCQYNVAPRKIQHDSFSNSTCISTLPCTDRKLTEIVL